MAPKTFTREQILPGISKQALPLFDALWFGKHISSDAAFSLAQYAASCGTNKLNGESLLLCILSDYMATPQGCQMLRDNIPSPF